MSVEEFNKLRTELLVTQQKNIGINGELDSLRQRFRLAKHIIGKKGYLIEQSTILSFSTNCF